MLEQPNFFADIGPAPSPGVSPTPPAGQAPAWTINPDDLKWLETALKANPAWQTAADLLASVGRVGEDHRRWLRQLASASEWIISGQRGYKHIDHATLDEINHAANWLESQAKKMSDRACTLRRNSHRKIA